VQQGSHVSESSRAVEYFALEVGCVHVIAIPQRHEVLPFFRTVEPVHHEDVVDAAHVERPHERAADKTGATGDGDPASVERMHAS